MLHHRMRVGLWWKGICPILMEEGRDAIGRLSAALLAVDFDFFVTTVPSLDFRIFGKCDWGVTG